MRSERAIVGFHVLESRETRNFFNGPELGTVFGFFSPGIVYGRPPIPRESFVFLHEAATIKGERESPLLHLPNETVNVYILLFLILLILECTMLIIFDVMIALVKLHHQVPVINDGIHSSIINVQPAIV